jgi:hypothetical protein
MRSFGNIAIAVGHVHAAASPASCRRRDQRMTDWLRSGSVRYRYRRRAWPGAVRHSTSLRPRSSAQWVSWKTPPGPCPSPSPAPLRCRRRPRRDRFRPCRGRSPAVASAAPPRWCAPRLPAPCSPWPAPFRRPPPCRRRGGSSDGLHPARRRRLPARSPRVGTVSRTSCGPAGPGCAARAARPRSDRSVPRVWSPTASSNHGQGPHKTLTRHHHIVARPTRTRFTLSG